MLNKVPFECSAKLNTFEGSSQCEEVSKSYDSHPFLGCCGPMVPTKRLKKSLEYGLYNVKPGSYNLPIVSGLLISPTVPPFVFF